MEIKSSSWKRIRDSPNFGLFLRRKIGIGVVLEVLIKLSFLSGEDLTVLVLEEAEGPDHGHNDQFDLHCYKYSVPLLIKTTKSLNLFKMYE